MTTLPVYHASNPIKQHNSCDETSDNIAYIKFQLTSMITFNNTIIPLIAMRTELTKFLDHCIQNLQISTIWKGYYLRNFLTNPPRLLICGGILIRMKYPNNLEQSFDNIPLQNCICIHSFIRFL